MFSLFCRLFTHISYHFTTRLLFNRPIFRRLPSLPHPRRTPEEEPMGILLVQDLSQAEWLKWHPTVSKHRRIGKKRCKKLVPWGTDGRLPLSDLDLDLGSGHTAYRRASLIELYLRTKFHWDRKKNFFEGHHWGFGQVQSHVTQKLGQISKIRPDQI